MMWLSLFVLLAGGGVVQAVFPPVTLLGRTPLPVLPALVVYYALTRDEVFMLVAAVLAGIVHDSLGLVPLGYSSFSFGVGALLVHRFRADVFAWDAVTHAVMGLAVAGGTTLALSLLLRITRQIALPPSGIFIKTTGAALLGMLVTPLVCAGAERLDRQLDILGEKRR